MDNINDVVAEKIRVVKDRAKAVFDEQMGQPKNPAESVAHTAGLIYFTAGYMAGYMDKGKEESSG